MGLVAVGQAVGMAHMSFDLWAVLLAVAGTLGTVAAAWIKGRAAGRNSVIVEQTKNDARTRKEFDRIDRQSPDVDASLERLRQRAKSRGADPK